MIKVTDIDANAEVYYNLKLEALVCNTILHLSDIAKLLDKNLTEFTENVGFSISAVSRLRRKVQSDPRCAMDHFTYALCMLTSLDSVYLFSTIKREVRKEIEELLLSNLYDKAETEIEDIMGCFDPRWLVIDYKEGRGFVYQVQFFLSELQIARNSNRLAALEQDITEKIKHARVAFTVSGLRTFITDLDNIKDTLSTAYEMDFTKEYIYVSDLVRSKILFGDIPDNLPDYVKICERDDLIKQLDDNNYPPYVTDFWQIIISCNTENCLLLVFIGKEDEIPKYHSIIKDTIFDNILFIYKRYFENIGHYKLVINYKSNIFEATQFTSGKNNYDISNIFGSWQ